MDVLQKFILWAMQCTVFFLFFFFGKFASPKNCCASRARAYSTILFWILVGYLFRPHALCAMSVLCLNTIASTYNNQSWHLRPIQRLNYRRISKQEWEWETALIYENLVNNMACLGIYCNGCNEAVASVQLHPRSCTYWTDFTLQKFLENSGLLLSSDLYILYTDTDTHTVIQ